MREDLLTHIDDPGTVTLAGKWRRTLIAFVVIGVLALALGLKFDPSRAWADYLWCYTFFLFVSVVGLFFVAMHHAANATWMLTARRLAEGLTAYLPVAMILFIGVIFGEKSAYPWATGVEVHDPLKLKWLSPIWFSARHVIFLVIWILFARKIVGLSLAQDQSGDAKLSRKMINWSIAFLPIFGLTFALGATDLLMSVEPSWFSTMFGVYAFAGMFQMGLALLAIMYVIVKRKGLLAQVYTPSQLKDFGTMVFAFTIFMTYIGFAQYLLIWYANLPDETSFFLYRQDGGWQFVFLTLVLFKFAIPFFGLLSQAAKKSENWMLFVCGIVVLGEILDLYWIIMPARHPVLVPISWMEIGMFLGFAGVFSLTVARFFARHSVLAVRDPRILKSANWRYWE